jgi:hypothetical protein
MPSRTRVKAFLLELLLLASLAAIGAHAENVTLNPSSSRIQWQGSWSTSDNFRVSLGRSQTFAVFWSGTHSLATATPSPVCCSRYDADDDFCYYQGTGIHISGKVQGNFSAVFFSLDNYTTMAPQIPDQNGLVYSMSGLESGDHQLLMFRLPAWNITTNFYLYNITLVLSRFHTCYTTDIVSQTGTGRRSSFPPTTL